jgi:hypothetical protein
MLGHAEEAGTDLAIRRQPNAVAAAAERLAHRRDDADLAPPVRELAPLGG